MDEALDTTDSGKESKSAAPKKRTTKRGNPSRRLTFPEKKQIIEMVAQGMPVMSAARALECSSATVYRTLQDFEHLAPELKDIEIFRKHRPGLIDAAQRKVLKYATKDEVLAKASANNLGYLFRQLYDSNRLELGLSTANASTVVRFTTLPDIDAATHDPKDNK